MLAEGEDEDFENDEQFKQLDYHEQLIFREQKYLYKQQRMLNNDREVTFKENPHLRGALMSKLGLLKDSDFKVMHDRKLPVSADDMHEVNRFIETIKADVKFLEGLRIMDYSLFLIVLEMPAFAVGSVGGSQRNEHNPSTASADDIKIQCNEIDLTQQQHNAMLA